MKMCNYFLGDAYASGRKLGDDRCDEFMLAEFEDSTECEAAAHAINNHDALVEALQVLLSCIGHDKTVNMSDESLREIELIYKNAAGES